MSKTQTLGLDEAYRRLPALHLIQDEVVREETVRLSAEAPKYFWTVPAARPSSDYHHPLCRQQHGLWAHSLMLVAPISRLSETYLEQNNMDAIEREYALSAAILHDQRKYGDPDDKTENAASDHDLQMAAVIEEESDLPQPVADAVSSHMGAWYDGPAPSTPLQHLVHDADMLASTAVLDAHVPEPVPEELAGIGVQGGEFDG